MGPTAVGKTALAMALADRVPCQLISVDSGLVYRGMDIGTAKPTPAELARYPHALVDVVEPTEAYSAARFVHDAMAAIASALSAGRLPVLVGGTMLYFKALRDGLSVLPEADLDLRAALEAEAAVSGWPALHARLQAVDPRTAARLSPQDGQRLQRAWEVWHRTGRPLSDWHDQPVTPPELPVTLHWVALQAPDRAILHARIEQRFRAMLAAGLVDEVRALQARGDLTAEMPSQRAVGYRQVWQYLAGQIDEPTLLATGIAATRQLAKRQLTWLRSWPAHATYAADDPQTVTQILQAIHLPA